MGRWSRVVVVVVMDCDLAVTYHRWWCHDDNALRRVMLWLCVVVRGAVSPVLMSVHHGHTIMHMTMLHHPHRGIHGMPDRDTVASA
jgi:hypothetical protein